MADEELVRALEEAEKASRDAEIQKATADIASLGGTVQQALGQSSQHAVRHQGGEDSLNYATTAEIADVALTESAGTSLLVARGDHAHLIGLTLLDGVYVRRDGTLALTGNWDWGAFTIGGFGASRAVKAVDIQIGDANFSLAYYAAATPYIEMGSGTFEGIIYDQTGHAIHFYVNAAQPRMSIETGGAVKMPFATSTTNALILGADAAWYRSAADVMRTPDALTVDGIFTLKENSAPSTPASTFHAIYPTTTNNLYAKGDDGTVRNVTHPLSVSLTLELPTATESKVPIHRFKEAVTVSRVRAVIAGTGTPSCTINPKHSANLSDSGTALLDAATAITNTGAGQDLTAFTDATIAADEILWLDTTAASGTTRTWLHIQVEYVVD